MASTERDRFTLALEWRATMSLARLQHSIGRHDEAHGLLRQDYARFGGGFASLDLVEGKRLLDAMRRSESREPLLPA